MIPYDEVLQAVARGWCAPKNEHKVMDPDLAEAIAVEVYTSASNHEPYTPAAEIALSANEEAV
jgi:hypothetical protein